MSHVTRNCQSVILSAVVMNFLCCSRVIVDVPQKYIQLLGRLQSSGRTEIVLPLSRLCLFASRNVCVCVCL